MGDFQVNFHRPDSGIRTVEGNLAGNRAAALEKKRQQEQELFEQRKKQIIADSSSNNDGSSNSNRFNYSIQTKFAGGATQTLSEKSFQSKTIGLVTVDEFKRIQAQQNRNGLNSNDDDDDDDDNKNKNNVKSKEEIALLEKAARKERKKQLKAKKKMLSTLSFAGEEDEEVEEEENDIVDQNDNDKGSVTTTTTKPRHITSSSKKDPTVDTSFLPDIERDVQIQEERAKLEREWKANQIRIKDEQLEIIYSYWDGSGHRRSCICKKGNTIGEFLQQVQEQLGKEFRELTKLSADGLLYIKEDLIIPYDITFYDLIVTKARGKSGPLFHFDVHDDIRTGTIDVRIEKDESHPGKVVDRRWYERNKHIFPASRWEYYNPLKDYGSYTIGGG